MNKKSMLQKFIIALLFAIFTAGTAAAGLFDNAEANRLIDENYALVQADGWAELRIPQSLHHISSADFGSNAIDAAKKLINAGYDVYVVGGSVRDILMGKPANDVDLATNASNEEIKATLDKVSFHEVNHKIFGIAHYPDEALDVSTFYNIHAAYHGQRGVPDFNPEERNTKIARNDSFRRDLTMNALYYDMRTDEIVDWHGGLHDIREGVIDTMTDADLSIRSDPYTGIRALRFKARYGIRFSDRLESAMRAHASEYLSLLEPAAIGSQTPRMFRGGFALSSFEVLRDYKVLSNLFPPVKEFENRESYLAFERNVMRLIDEQHRSRGTLNRSLFMAAMLWPVVEERTSESGFENALQMTLDSEAGVYRFMAKERGHVEATLHLEAALTLNARTANRTPAAETLEGIAASPYFGDAMLILRARAMSDPAAARVLKFWQDRTGEKTSLFTPEINRLIDENYALVQKNGWAKLVIPQAMHGIGEESFSPNCLAAAKALIAAGHDAYIIGGAVRDLIMGKPSNDFDIVTSATNDEIRAILPDVTFHAIQTGVEYAIAHYPNEGIDIASFTNIPAVYHGHENIPDFDPSELYGRDLLSDSFQRDLTFNAIYYEVATGDLIDFHGGLHDIREGVIETMTDAHLEFSHKPANAFRALRFKSRYGYRLSQRADEAIRAHIAEYAAKMEGTTLSNEITKMEFTGYSLTCWRTLSEYGAVPVVFPVVSDIHDTPAYRDYMEAALSALDAAYSKNKGDKGYRRYFITAALWPAIERETAKGTPFWDSVAKVLDAEGQVYVYWRTERRDVEEFLSVEHYLTHPRRLKPAEALISNPYFPAAFELLKVRARLNPSLAGFVVFWTRLLLYDADALKGLLRTENFLRSAINHIFIGGVKYGAAGGYHYAKIKGARGYILPSTREYTDSYGSYRAKVAVDGMPKDANMGYSTFFPDAMSPQEVVDAINEAYANRTPMPDSDSVSAGFAANGMEIIIFTSKEGKIISAFPRAEEDEGQRRLP